MGIQTWYDNTMIVDVLPEPNMREQLDRAIRIVQEGGTGDIVADFSQVEIINSLSLSGLLQLRRVLNDAGRRLILCSVGPMTKKIFNVTCLDSNFEFAEDKSTALLSIEGGKKNASAAAD